MLRPTRIQIPTRLRNLLHRDRSLEAGVLATLSHFEPWLEDNKLVFFPEFTDHGPDHIASVISTATFLITTQSWKALTPSDAAALVVCVLLHDCAMHISEDGFIALVSSEGSDFGLEGEPNWKQLWEQYVREAVRFDGRKLVALFGDAKAIEIPRLSVSEFNRRDRLLIGDFLRRHHARLAHEIAIKGVPSPVDDKLGLALFSNEVKDLFGWIARSHGMSMRQAVLHFNRNSRRLKLDVHTTYIMALLRIADYLQIEAPRAPKEVLQVRSLRSPLSQSEWAAHSVIPEITNVDDDRESLHVVAQPSNSKEFVHVTKLLQSLQKELYETWAALGEVYGPVASLQKLGLTIRRIRSNLDDVESFAAGVNFVPVHAAFTTASSDLLKLLIGPLYDYRSEIGIRELLQNAVDAVLERRDTTGGNTDNGHPDKQISRVSIDLVTDAEKPHVKITDTGVGMSVDILLNYFLRAGASFRYDDSWRTQHTDNLGRSRVLRSGRFGIGALGAFLLGDTLSVTTCPSSGEAAIAFVARLEDEQIELKRAVAPIGTTIRIPLDSHIANHLLHTHLWDFYCLEDPIVQRRVNGEVLKQRERWPACSSVLPVEWRRLETVDFADVQWSFWEPEGRTQIAVNGIRVEEIKMEEEPEGERYDSEDDEDDLDEDRARLRLSIFDKDARLPVNLQRTSVTNLPFRRALDEEIAKDFLAFAAVRLPSDVSLVSVFDPALRYPAQSSHAFRQNPFERQQYRSPRKSFRSPCFFSSPQGWILPTYSAVKHFRPERILYIVATPPGPAFSWNKSHFVCPEVAEFENYGNNDFKERFLNLLNYDQPSKILAPRETIRQLMQDGQVAGEILKAQSKPFYGEHSLLDFDDRRCLLLSEPKLMHGNTSLTESSHYFIAEMVDGSEDSETQHRSEGNDFYRSPEWPRHRRGVPCQGPQLPISYELAVSVWAELGVHSIPFAKEERAFILEHPQIREYADAHSRLWHDRGRLSYPDDGD